MVCQRCGAVNPDEVQVCTVCGFPLSESNVNTNPSDAYTPTNEPTPSTENVQPFNPNQPPQPFNPAQPAQPFNPNQGAQTFDPNRPAQPFYTQGGPTMTPPPYYAPGPAADPGKGFAIAALVMGILSLVCCGSALFGALGIIFGAVAKSKGSRSGMATAGIVCGIIGVVIWLVITICFPMNLAELTSELESMMSMIR